MKPNSHQQIVSYQENWKDKFESEKNVLIQKLGDLIINVEHIGSTSVEGLSSKPIIDIAVLINNYADSDKLQVPLEEIGYVLRGPGNERDFYSKGDPIEFHVSICFADRGGFYLRQLAFRNYLRNNDKDRNSYQILKTELLKKDNTGVGGYIEGKTDFVSNILQKADWKNETYKEFIKRLN